MNLLWFYTVQLPQRIFQPLECHEAKLALVRAIGPMNDLLTGASAGLTEWSSVGAGYGPRRNMGTGERVELSAIA
jgi:hypothetical protein